MDSIRNTITISDEEETKLGIPETLRGHSVIAGEVYDNSRLGTPPAIRDLHGDSPRWIRHTPMVSPSRQPPPPFTLQYYRPPIPFTTPFHNTPSSYTLAPPSNTYSNDVFH